MQIIYLDALAALNLLADYLLCLCAGKICGLYLRRGRYLAAAGLGAVYAAAVYYPPLAFLASPPLRLLTGLLMGLIAYGKERKPLRCTLVFLLTAAAFGGALYAVALGAGAVEQSGWIRLNSRMLFLSFALCYGALRLLSRFHTGREGKRRAEIRLGFLDRECHFFALMDSGNGLCDPVSGERILVVCPRALGPVLRENSALFQELDPVDLLEVTNGIAEWKGKLRLLPFRALGGGGLLPVFRPDALYVDGRAAKDLLVGISPRAAGEGHDGIL